MDLANPGNWSKVFDQQFNAVQVAQHGTGPGSILVYDPIPPAVTSLAPPIGLVKCASSTADPKWWLGCWAGAYQRLNGQRTQIYRRKCSLQSGTLLSIPNLGIVPYEIEFAIPKWLDVIHIELWQFTEQSGRYLPVNDQVLLTTMDVVSQRQAEIEADIEEIKQQQLNRQFTLEVSQTETTP